MAEIAIVGLTLIRCMQVRSEHLHNLAFPLSSNTRKPDRSACHTFAYEPVTSEESCWAAIERIAHHGAFDDGEGGQDGETAAEDARVVEFGVGEDIFGEAADSEVVFLGPAFLEADDVGSWNGYGDAVADFEEALVAECGQVFEAPAVESKDVERRRRELKWMIGVTPRCTIHSGKNAIIKPSKERKATILDAAFVHILDERKAEARSI